MSLRIVFMGTPAFAVARRGPAVLGQDGGVDVDGSQPRDVQQRLRQQLSVGRHHNHVRRKVPQLVQCRLVPAGNRLVHRYLLCNSKLGPVWRLV
mgnify:CR=1 FL=1